jgi:ADP-ribose pyrophosphatase YjhB (NUDIX family)
VRCVGAIINDDDGRLLLVQRGHAPAQGLWSIPGGRVEPGETDEQAVRREIAEETGLVVRVGELAGVVRRPGLGGSTYEIYDYDAAVDGAGAGAAIAASDAADLRWVWPDQVEDLPVTDGLVQCLRDWGRLP